ncbi:hypothetical protein NL676_024619 [Syzygium grande]|nr:hypothetical protein NL676_024619 [Syzygium grande]
MNVILNRSALRSSLVNFPLIADLKARHTPNSRSHRGRPPASAIIDPSLVVSRCRLSLSVPPSCCRHGRSDGAMGTRRGRPTDEYDPFCPHGLFALYFCSVRPGREEDLQLAWGRIMIGWGFDFFTSIENQRPALAGFVSYKCVASSFSV